MFGYGYHDLGRGSVALLRRLGRYLRRGLGGGREEVVQREQGLVQLAEFGGDRVRGLLQLVAWC